MTVKLLVDRPIDGKEYKAGNLCDTDDNTEAGLISSKLAIADLAGGTAYVAPVIQPQIIPVTATTNLTGGIESSDGLVALTASVACNGDGNDELRITAALAKNKIVRVTKNAVISGPIIINSGNTLEIADGITIKFADSVTTGNMIQNRAAVTVQRTIADGAVTSGSKTFVASSITTADIGRSVIIAGAATGNTHLCAKIVTAAAGSATLDIAAFVTVSGASCRFYDRDKNISIIGGTIDRNLAGGAAGPDSNGFYLGGHTALLRRIDGLKIDSVSFSGVSGKYAISVGDVKGVIVNNPRYNVASDGFHVQGPASDVRVSGSRGLTGDDPCAVTGADYATYNDVQGDVSNVEFSDTNMDSYEGRILFMSGPGFKVRGAKVNGLTGAVSSGVVLASGRNDVNFVPTFDSDVGCVEINGVDCDIPDTKYGVLIDSELARDIKISGMKWSATTPFVTYIRVNGHVDQLVIDGTIKPRSVNHTTHYGVHIGSAGVVESLIIKNTSIHHNTGSYLAVSVLIDGWVKNLESYCYSCINQTYTASGNNLIQTGSAGKIDRCIIDGLNEVNAKVVFTTVAGSTVGPISFGNFLRTGCSRIANALVAMDFTIGAGSSLSPLVEPFYVSGAALTIRGAGCYLDSSSKDGVARAASEVVRVMNIDFPVDSAKVASNAGDRHYNTNVASGPLKVGPCIYSGSAWKSLLNIT